MKYAFVLPDLDIATAPGLAAEAEAAGWDAVFIPDGLALETPDFPPSPMSDPWVTLAAMAMRTTRVQLGPMVAAVTRRRPWKLAREVATLDHLSGGRMILPVGLGAASDDAGFRETGEAMALRDRAAILDETLDILAGLWTGEPFSYEGAHFHIGRMTQLPPPVQRPRVPVWPVAVAGSTKSMDRALRWDGAVAQGRNAPLTLADVSAIRERARERIGDRPFAIVAEGSTPTSDAVAASSAVRAWREAGATWWVESRWSAHTTESVRARIQAGPPR